MMISVSGQQSQFFLILLGLQNISVISAARRGLRNFVVPSLSKTVEAMESLETLVPFLSVDMFRNHRKRVTGFYSSRGISRRR